MNRIVLAVVGVLTVSVSAQAQTPAETIALAIDASLLRFGGDATLIRWNADYTYETVKQGNNTVVCYDRSDERDRSPFSAQCTSLANLDRVAQNRRFRAETTDTAGETAVPGATTRSTGLPVDRTLGGVWIMEAVTSAAHIMIPGR